MLYTGFFALLCLVFTNQVTYIKGKETSLASYVVLCKLIRVIYKFIPTFGTDLNCYHHQALSFFVMVVELRAR